MFKTFCGKNTVTWKQTLCLPPGKYVLDYMMCEVWSQDEEEKCKAGIISFSYTAWEITLHGNEIKINSKIIFSHVTKLHELISNFTQISLHLLISQKCDLQNFQILTPLLIKIFYFSWCILMFSSSYWPTYNSVFVFTDAWQISSLSVT